MKMLFLLAFMLPEASASCLKDATNIYRGFYLYSELHNSFDTTIFEKGNIEVLCKDPDKVKHFNEQYKEAREYLKKSEDKLIKNKSIHKDQVQWGKFTRHAEFVSDDEICESIDEMILETGNCKETREIPRLFIDLNVIENDYTTLCLRLFEQHKKIQKCE
jgi:hypothetical protein